MLLTPDDILKRVLTAIAYSGHNGLPIARFDETIREFIPSASSAFRESAWKWIQRSGDDISVGTVISHSIPVSDLHGQSVQQLLEKFGDDVRFFASEEAQKKALIPSPEARAVIVGFAFQVLCTVAQAGSGGILVTDIARQTGQDPRSLFQRVKTLVNHNLVSKIPVTHNKARTSLITFLGSKDGTKPQVHEQQGNSTTMSKIDTKRLRKDIIYTLEKAPDGLRQKFDLRNQLGFNVDPTHRKSFNRIMLELEVRGLVNLLTVKTVIDDRTYKWACVKLVKATNQPIQTDNTYGYYDDESEDQSDGNDDSLESETEEQQEENEEENEEMKLDPDVVSNISPSPCNNKLSGERQSQIVTSEYPIPCFSLFLPSDLQIYNFVNSRPINGVSSMKLMSSLMGWDFNRPISALLEKLTSSTVDKKSKSKKNQSFGPFSLMRGQDYIARRSFYRYFTIANYLLSQGMGSEEISSMIGESEFGESLYVRSIHFRGERLNYHLPAFQGVIEFNTLYRDEGGYSRDPTKSVHLGSAVASPSPSSKPPSPALPPKKRGRPKKHPRPEDEAAVPKIEPLENEPPVDVASNGGEKSSEQLPAREASSLTPAPSEPTSSRKGHGRPRKARLEQETQEIATVPGDSTTTTATEGPCTDAQQESASPTPLNKEAKDTPILEASTVNSPSRLKRGRPRKYSLPKQADPSVAAREVTVQNKQEAELPASKRVRTDSEEPTEAETDKSEPLQEATPTEKNNSQGEIEVGSDNNAEGNNIAEEIVAIDQSTSTSESAQNDPMELPSSVSQPAEPSTSEKSLHDEVASETKRKAPSPEANNSDEDRKKVKTLSGLDRYRAYKTRYRQHSSRPNVLSSPLAAPSPPSTPKQAALGSSREPRMPSSKSQTKSSAHFAKMLSGGLKFAAQQRHRRVMELLQKHGGLLRAGDELQTLYNATYKPTHQLDSSTLYRDLESLISKGMIQKIAVSVEMSSGNRVMKWIIVDSNIPLDSPEVKEFEKSTIEKQKAYSPYAFFKPRPVVQGNVSLYSDAGRERLEEIKKAIEKAKAIKAQKEANRQEKKARQTIVRQDIRTTMRKAQSEKLNSGTREKRKLYEFSVRDIDTLLRGVIVVFSLSKATFEWAKLKTLFKDIPLTKIKTKVRELKKTDFSAPVQEKYFTRWKRIFLPAYRTGKLTMPEDSNYDVRGFVNYWRDTEANYAKIRDLKTLPRTIEGIHKLYNVIPCATEDIIERITTFHSYTKEREVMALLSFSKESVTNKEDNIIDTPEATEIRSLIYNHDLFSEDTGKFSRTIGKEKRAKMNETIQKMRRLKILVRVRDNSAPRSKWDFIDKVHSVFKMKPSANVLEDACGFIETLKDILNQENKGFVISRAPPISTAMVLIDFVARGIIEFGRSWPENEPRPGFYSISQSRKISARYSSKEIGKESVDYDIVVKRGPKWKEFQSPTNIGVPSSDDGHYGPCQYSWISASGRLNKHLLVNLMEGLVFYVLAHPGLQLDLLDKRLFRGGLSRREIDLLVSFLVEKSVLQLSKDKALTLGSHWLSVRYQ